MNIPNSITLLRIALVPVFTVLMNLDAAKGGGTGFRIASMVVFIAACSTDWIDGYLARKWQQITTFGKFVDPLADKLLVTAALLQFVSEGVTAAWIALVILAREFIVTSLRMVAVGGGTVIAAGFSGKAKTFLQMTLIVVMLTPAYGRLLPFGHSVRLCDLCSWLMLAVTLWSGIDYLWRYRGILRQNMR